MTVTAEKETPKSESVFKCTTRMKGKNDRQQID